MSNKKPIKHGSYRIERDGAWITLNDNESQLDRQRTELVIQTSTDDIGSPEGILLQATFDDGGFLKSYTGLTMTTEQAKSLSRRLEMAIEAKENSELGSF